MSKDQAVQMALAILESAMVGHSKDSPKKKGSKKKLIIIGVAVILCVAVSLVLGLLILRVKTPKFRLTSVVVNDLSFTNTTSYSSFEISLDAVYAVKNPNYAPYEYRDSYVSFSYRGKRVGRVRIAEAKAKALSTKEEGFTVSLSSRAFSAGSDLGRDIGSGVVGLSVGSEMRGQVDFIPFIKVIKKDRTPRMSCTMVLNLVDKVVQDLKCD